MPRLVIGVNELDNRDSCGKSEDNKGKRRVDAIFVQWEPPNGLCGHGVYDAHAVARVRADVRVCGQRHEARENAGRFGAFDAADAQVALVGRDSLGAQAALAAAARHRQRHHGRACEILRRQHARHRVPVNPWGSEPPIPCPPALLQARRNRRWGEARHVIPL